MQIILTMATILAVAVLTAVVLHQLPFTVQCRNCSTEQFMLERHPGTSLNIRMPPSRADEKHAS